MNLLSLPRRSSVAMKFPQMTVSHHRASEPTAELRRLIAYFDRPAAGFPASVRCLGHDDGRAIGCYDGLRLHSVFQPLFLTATMQPLAWEALLRANDADGRVISPEQAFGIPKSAEDIVYFDRLCRTVHALNFIRLAAPDDLLFLNVGGGHLLNVGSGNHGDIFETLLRHCGLKPDQVVLEIIESRIDNLGWLVEAVAAYQKRGYRVAIDDFGCQHSNFDRLWQLSPDIVKLDRSLIVQSEINPRARIILPKLVEIIHDLGAHVVCEGIETPTQHALAVGVGVDLVQGFYYARPRPELVRRSNA
jgi:EAL domain-containing protein (putative c-di-GMP-specific phosphodiesterase class I)